MAKAVIPQEKHKNYSLKLKMIILLNRIMRCEQKHQYRQEHR